MDKAPEAQRGRNLNPITYLCLTQGFRMSGDVFTSLLLIPAKNVIFTAQFKFISCIFELPFFCKVELKKKLRGFYYAGELY